MNQIFALILVNFNYILPPVIVAVVMLKVFTFFRYRSATWKYSNLFYFSKQQIVSAESFKKLNIKMTQNVLSYYGLFLIIIYAILLSIK